MSYTVTFGRTLKRINSTSQNYTDLSGPVSCVLKAPTDILAPTFTYQGAFPENSNYMYVAEWNKYFWITSAVFGVGHWEISGKCDVLATYKNAIGTRTEYIARSSTRWNGLIADSKCIANGVATSNHNVLNLGFSAAGSYIVGVAGKSGTMYYACSKVQFDEMYSKIFSNGFLTDLCTQAADVILGVQSTLTQNLDVSLYNSFVNPGQYIQSAIWIPFSVSGVSTRIYAGVTDVGSGIPVSASDLVYDWNFTLDIANTFIHPQASTLGSWVRGNLGTRLILNVPAIGQVTVDMSSLTDYVYLGYSCDVFGGVSFIARTSGSTVIRTGNIGAQVGIANIKTDVSGALCSLSSVAAGIASDNPAMLAHGIMNGISSLLPSVDSITSGASRSIVASFPVIIYDFVYQHFNETNLQTQGRPLCATSTIALCPGYIECENASISTAGATFAESQEINQFLNGGFYYE